MNDTVPTISPKSPAYDFTRVGNWLVFSVIIALTPLAFVYLSGLLRGVERDVASIIGKGELLIVVIALSGAAIGDLMMSQAVSRRARLWCGGTTLIVFLFSAFLYVDVANAFAAGEQLDVQRVVTISIWLFGIGLVSNAGCIAVAE